MSLGALTKHTHRWKTEEMEEAERDKRKKILMGHLKLQKIPCRTAKTLVPQCLLSIKDVINTATDAPHE